MGLSAEALMYSVSFAGLWFVDRFNDTDAARKEFLAFHKASKFASLLDYYSAISPDLLPVGEPRGGRTWYHCRGCFDMVNRTLLEERICYVFHIKPIEAGFGAYSGHRVIDIQYERKSGDLLEDAEDWYLYFSPWPDLHVTVHPKLTISMFRRYVIKLNVQKFESLDRRERPCHTSFEGDSYSSMKRMIQCHNALYKQALGCGLLWLELSPLNMTPKRICNRADRIPPKNLTLQEFFETQENERIDATAADDCVKRCTPECDKMVYETATLIQENYLESEKKHARDANVSVMSIQLRHGNVYQGGMVVSREIYIYSFTLLLNNIGGTLGLFVGGTLMTVVQLLLFFVNYMLAGNKRS